MADHKHQTAHDDPADHGHHGHHILSPKVLLGTFAALVGLTILTVMLAFMERADIVHFGGAGSVIVALLIAGVKGTLVAMFFMALKYDNRVNALALVMSIVFLAIFFGFTYLDTGFRGEFERVPDARALDQIRMERMEAERAGSEIEERFREQSVVAPGDTTLLGPTPDPAGSSPAPTDSPPEQP